MPRPSKNQIAENIRCAVVRATASKGISAVSMAHVAKEAKVSAGTLYLHFDNKTDMLQKTYMHIKRDFYASLMQACTGQDTATKVRQFWMAMFAYVQKQPEAFLFIDNTGAFQILSETQASETRLLQQDITNVLSAGILDGTLADLPLKLMTTLLVSPAFIMARTGAMENSTYTQADLDLTFERVWLSICATTFETV
ncbi:MAG: TetR/AcrR family transcriptional regulator [Cognatishimia sp.]|uniref:TetR/AcrR family transcriptional regulator n=1 Tax=Cognatishimia sp. TaxID=2211648 RepID=UPI003B8DE797